MGLGGRWAQSSKPKALPLALTVAQSPWLCTSLCIVLDQPATHFSCFKQLFMLPARVLGSWAMLPWFFSDAFVCSLVISHEHVFPAFSLLLCPAVCVCLSVSGVLCFYPFYICWPTSLPNVYLFVASPFASSRYD